MGPLIKNLVKIADSSHIFHFGFKNLMAGDCDVKYRRFHFARFP